MPQEYIKIQKSLSAYRENIDMPLMEDFEDTTLRWSIGKSNTSGNATRDTTKSFRGTACVKLDTGGTNPAANDYISISRQIRPVRDPIITISLEHQPVTTFIGSQLTIETSITNYQKGKRYIPQIRIDNSGMSPNYQYKDSSGNWVTFIPSGGNLSATSWQHIEVVVDLNKGEYLYAIAGQKKVSLAKAKMPEGTVLSQQSDYINITLRTTAAAQRQDYIDDIIVDKIG
jgi:hypothetical protein